MKKLIILFTVLLASFSSVNAQKGINHIMIGADIGLPTGQFADVFDFGAGPVLKFLFGTSRSGQITATTGVDFFHIKKDILPPGFKLSYRIIPILAGYRHNFNGVYIEPQLGAAIYGSSASYQGDSESTSETAFTWAAGIGFVRKSLDIGLRYQSGEKDGESLGMLGLHIAYIMKLASKK